jgi:hypothetical protein
MRATQLKAVWALHLLVCMTTGGCSTDLQLPKNHLTPDFCPHCQPLPQLHCFCWDPQGRAVPEPAWQKNSKRRLLQLHIHRRAARTYPASYPSHLTPTCWVPLGQATNLQPGSSSPNTTLAVWAGSRQGQWPGAYLLGLCLPTRHTCSSRWQEALEACRLDSRACRQYRPA